LGGIRLAQDEDRAFAAVDVPAAVNSQTPAAFTEDVGGMRGEVEIEGIVIIPELSDRHAVCAGDRGVNTGFNADTVHV